MGDPRALWLLQVKSISAVTTSSSSLPAAMFRRTALLLAPCNHGVEACVGQDSTQSGPGWMHGCMDGWMEGQTLCSPTVRHQPPQHPWELHPGPAPQKCAHKETVTPVLPSVRALLSILAGQRSSPPSHSRFSKSLKTRGILSHA